MTHVDPVCGMTIEEADAVGTFDHEGVRYYFCAPQCLERFAEDPDAFLSPRDEAGELVVLAPLGPLLRHRGWQVLLVGRHGRIEDPSGRP